MGIAGCVESKSLVHIARLRQRAHPWPGRPKHIISCAVAAPKQGIRPAIRTDRRGSCQQSEAWDLVLIKDRKEVAFGLGNLDSRAGAGGCSYALIRTETHERQRAPKETQRQAARQVADALAAVYALIEQADVKKPSSTEISKVMGVFEAGAQRWEAMLPVGARYLRISVRQAMANCFGDPVCAGLDPKAANKPDRAFNRYWWDIGCTYIENVRKHIGFWLADEAPNKLRLTPNYGMAPRRSPLLKQLMTADSIPPTDPVSGGPNALKPTFDRLQFTSLGIGREEGPVRRRMRRYRLPNVF